MKTVELSEANAGVLAFVSHLIRAIIYLIVSMVVFFNVPALSSTQLSHLLGWIAVVMITSVAVKPKNSTITERLMVVFELPVTVALFVVAPAYGFGLEVGKLMGIFYLVMMLYNLVTGFIAFAEYKNLI